MPIIARFRSLEDPDEVEFLRSRGALHPEILQEARVAGVAV
jgi:hypothetical protein